MVAIAAVVTLALVIAVVSTRGSDGGTNTAGTTPVSNPSSIIDSVVAVPADVVAAVRPGVDIKAPVPIAGPALTKDGLPLVLYVGGEFCPYCAAQRWAMVQALSRFGTFTNLALATSGAAPEPFPNTPTFTFHGSTYSSPYVGFDGVELFDGVHKALDVLSPSQEAAFKTNSPQGSFPFMDFGGQYLIAGASYSPGVLTGKSAAQIVSALSTPSGAIAQGVLGSANMMTATICLLTNNQPTQVCSVPVIADLEGVIKAQSPR